MKLELDLKKSLHENAGDYYDQSKKMKHKVEGAFKALEISKKKFTSAEKEEVATKLEKKRDRDWFEKFHWMRTRNGLLVIAGRDATSNEQVVKKQMKQNDLFFHADIQGASATLLIGGQSASPEDVQDAARLAAVFSKAWNAGVGAINVYSVKAEQVKTAAKAGEFLAKGSFVMDGKREWFKGVPLEIFAVMVEGVPTLSAVDGLRIIPGKIKKSDLAKKLANKLGGTVDDWLQVVPNGGELK